MARITIKCADCSEKTSVVEYADAHREGWQTIGIDMIANSPYIICSKCVDIRAKKPKHKFKRDRSEEEETISEPKPEVKAPKKRGRPKKSK